MTNDTDEVKTMIEDCESRRMSEWETDFIFSLKLQLAAKKALSEKQIAKLNEVWERVTEKG